MLRRGRVALVSLRTVEISHGECELRHLLGEDLEENRAARRLRHGEEVQAVGAEEPRDRSLHDPGALAVVVLCHAESVDHLELFLHLFRELPDYSPEVTRRLDGREIRDPLLVHAYPLTQRRFASNYII